MEYLTVKQASDLWNISERRIIKLLNENRIPGAIQNGRYWSIPVNAHKPIDKRNNYAKNTNEKK